MRTALVVGATAVGAAVAGLTGYKLYQDSSSTASDADESIRAVLRGNEKLFKNKELSLIKALIDRGQSHLFAAWPAPGIQDALKRKLVGQLMTLDAHYHGGLCAYIDNAKKLLLDSKEGKNPFEGFSPSVPHGEKLDFASQHFMDLEKEGVSEAGHTAFVLVAGGLGERLGYKGIKVALPCESASGTCFLQLYCRFIAALQQASGSGKKLPFAIMTSDDTHQRTLDLLVQHKYFGLDKHQVHLMKQEKVACLLDNNASLALDPTDSYAVQTKPHGHGDVHALLHSTGLASKWQSHGFKWVAFFQDTNALVFRALTAALGVSARNDYDMNSLAVPRKAKEAIGAIACLKHADGRQLTINVEYNQLDPLLRSTISKEGDVNDASGWSPFPGNINQIIIKLDSYVSQLQQTGGVISEFVNPKYKDSTKTEFKSSTRLECMMQDYPKALPDSAKVGFTTINQVWASYSPVKNNPTDAAAKAKEGNPTHSATTGEMDMYRLNCYLLEQMVGVSIPGPQQASFNDIPCQMYPRVVLSPDFAPVVTSVKDKIAAGSVTLANASSVLIIDGVDIQFKGPVKVSGALVIKAVQGAQVTVGPLFVDNKGWEWQALASGQQAPEEEVIRGFRVVKHETAEYVFNKPGKYTVGDVAQAPPSTSFKVPPVAAEYTLTPTPTEIVGSTAAPLTPSGSNLGLLLPAGASSFSDSMPAPPPPTPVPSEKPGTVEAVAGGSSTTSSPSKRLAANLNWNANPFVPTVGADVAGGVASAIPAAVRQALQSTASAVSTEGTTDNDQHDDGEGEDGEEQHGGGEGAAAGANRKKKRKSKGKKGHH